MPSSLHTIPVDVLEYIAFLATSPPFVQPKGILNLLLTCRAIHTALSIRSCPQLYARLFQSEFDFDPSRRFEEGLTDSALTAELVQRHQLLRRVRARDMSGAGLLQDLWTALWMILEHSSLNTPQLLNARFPEFIIDVMCTHLQDVNSRYKEETRLSLWLATLTLTTGDAQSKSEETRDRILSLLRPFVLNVRDPGIIPHPAVELSRDTTLNLKQEERSVFHYSRVKFRTCPDALYPAIILTFALKEVDVLQAPPHLPIDRATALATQRSGPTMQDYEVVSAFRTPLFADCDPYKQRGHQVAELDQFLGTSDSAPDSRNPPPLEGVWEGLYMVAPDVGNYADSSSSTTCEDQDYLCRTPMQCCIDPLGRGSSLPRQSEVIRPYEETERVINPSEQFGDGDVYTPVNDDTCLPLKGETSKEHEEAWGGFRFIGKTTTDGSIILKRTPKDSMDLESNIWVFEGKLCYQSAFVGRWRSSEIETSSGIRGVFSLRKRPKGS